MKRRMEINVVVVTPVIVGQLCFRGNQMNLPRKWVFEISIRSNRIYLLHNIVLVSIEKMISYVLKEASNVKLEKEVTHITLIILYFSRSF